MVFFGVSSIYLSLLVLIGFVIGNFLTLVVLFRLLPTFERFCIFRLSFCVEEPFFEKILYILHFSEVYYN
jgi:hypothetical protein